MRKGLPLQSSLAEGGQALIFLLVGVLVIVTIGGAFYLGRPTFRQNSSGQVTPKLSPTPVAISQTPQTIPTPYANLTQTSDSKLSKKEIRGICDHKINYQTGLGVQNEIDAQNAFQKYVDYMKTNKMQDSNLAVDWTFTKAEYAGYYQNLSYWVITFHYTMTHGEKGNSQTHISQKGDIVDLLSCI